MLSIGTKKYRNVQEQVAYNTECIKKLDEYLDGITIEDKLVVIESDSGTFTDEELVILSGPLAFISNGSRVWMKDSESLVEFVYKAIDIVATEVGSTYFNIGGSKIVVNRETGAYNTSSDTIISTYSKSQIDSIVANIMAIKADKTEVALKADIAGQAFTGAITAPSIIEGMTGYSAYLPNSSRTVGFSPVYTSAVKNGNKLTLVGSAMINLASAENARYDVANFTIPTEIYNKITPAFGFVVEIKKLVAQSSATSYVETYGRVLKNATPGSISLNVSVNGLSANTDYFIRFEVTILLSENLIPS